MSEEELWAFIHGFCDAVRSDLQARVDMFPKDLFEADLHEAVLGLLARQASLTMELAKSPGTWNGHAAPLFHRAMSDVHITIGYILKADQASRAKDYVLYGLGQEKLQIAHLERLATEQGRSIEEDQQVQARKWWLASQRFEHLTVVNVGSATGLSTREMAAESDNMSIYDFNFTPFSACVDSTWQHVGRHNVSPCENPLHGGHFLPVTPELESSSWELVVATRTFRHTLQEVDGFTSVSLPCQAMKAIEAMRNPEGTGG